VSTNDPMEQGCANILAAAGIRFIRDDAGSGLDFYLPDFDTYIEVKQFYTERIAEQMSRRPNVIAIQGLGALEALRRILPPPPAER